MPELPEVETLKRELSKVLVSLKIKDIEVLWPKVISPLTPGELVSKLKNKKIVGVKRRAKILFLNLDGPLSLAIHLKMTGQLIYKNITGGHPDNQMLEKQPSKYTRLIFEFSDKSKLYFNDLRKFGWIKLVNDKDIEKISQQAGPEPLSPQFTPQYLQAIFKRYPKRSIKQILLDQKLIAGIGNIYADEACFLTKVLPNKKVTDLKPEQTKRLREAIISVLKLSIQKKGTSSKNYRRSDGSRGGFVPYLNVYSREGEPCKVCNRPIQKIRHAGRGTHYCASCQK